MIPSAKVKQLLGVDPVEGKVRVRVVTKKETATKLLELNATQAPEDHVTVSVISVV
jgi:hypothetical protein